MKFEKKFRHMIRGQRLNASYPYLKKDGKWLLKLSILVLPMTFCLYLLIYSLFMHDLKAKNHTVAYRNAFMTIVTILVLTKYFILIYHQRPIKNMMNIINKHYVLSKTMSPEEQKIIIDYSDKGAMVCKLWFVLSIATSGLFPLKAFILMGYYYYKQEFKLVPILELTPPEILHHRNEIWNYIWLFILQILFCCHAASVFMGFEALGPIFITHACGQLELAKTKILDIFSETDSCIIRRKMKEVIVMLQDVYKFVDETNRVFTVLYEVNMKFTTIAIPCSVYLVMESLQQREINLEFMSFSFGCIMHIFIPCYYSDLLKEKGESVRQAMYECGWELNNEVPHRKTLLFMMARASKPALIRTIFCVLCLDAFADMCHQAYALFNLMTVATT